MDPEVTRGPGAFPPRKGHFPPATGNRETQEEKTMLFSKTRAKINQQIDDRITSPVRTGIVISVTAFIIAVIALITAGKNASR